MNIISKYLNVSPKGGLIIVILILLNVLSHSFSFRLDLTKDQRFTLSDGTKEILANLEEPLTIKAYMSKDLNPEFDNHRRDVLNMLEEYRELAGGNIELVEINPTESPELEEEAKTEGIPSFQTGQQGRDKLEIQLAYFGLSFQYADQSDVIQVLQPNQPIEFPISRMIKKIAVLNKPKVALLQGHGEPSLAGFSQAMKEVSVNYELVAFNFQDTAAGKLSDYAALVVLTPKDSMSPQELGQIQSYYQSGGKIFLGYTKGQLSQSGQNSPPMFVAASQPIESWLQSIGVTFEEKLIIDAKAGQIMVPQGPFQMPIQFHYFPIVEKFADHPITDKLQGMVFQFAAPIVYDGSGDYQPIAFTSEMSGTEDMPVFIDISKQWREGDFTQAHLSMAGTITEGDNKMVIVSNGEFFYEGEGQQKQQVSPDNINFFVNSLDWLTGNMALMDLRNSGFSSAPIKKMEESDVSFYKILNFIMPFLLILVYGFLRFQSNKSKKAKWKEMSL